MGNRSRYVAAGSAAAGVAGIGLLVRARRHSRLGQAARDFVEVVMPSVAREAPSLTPTATDDEAHASGHQHLPLTGEAREEEAPATVRSRPFAKHRQGLRHPGKGS